MVISITKIVTCTFTNDNDVFMVVQGGGGGVSQHTGTTNTFFLMERTYTMSATRFLFSRCLWWK